MTSYDCVCLCVPITSLYLAKQRDEERITMMIDLLCKRDEYAMRDFLLLLRETGHEFIADHLTESRGEGLLKL